MPTEADHIQLANKNGDALNYLKEKAAEYPEWTTTVAFYKAVQIVEAIFRKHRGKNCHDHPSRLRLLKSEAYPIALYKHFRVLWAASTVARYLQDNDSRQQYSQFSDYVAPEEVVDKFVKKRLMEIENLALPFLSTEMQETLNKARY